MCLLALSSAYGVLESTIRGNLTTGLSSGHAASSLKYRITILNTYFGISELENQMCTWSLCLVSRLIHTIQAGPLGALTQLNRWSESFQACPHPFKLTNLKSPHTLGHVFHNIYNNPKNKREGWPWLSCGAIIGL